MSNPERGLIDKIEQKQWHDLTVKTYDTQCRCYTPTEMSYTEMLCKLVKKYCQLQPGMRILEVGCGTGTVTSPLIQHNQGTNFVGLDISVESLKEARGKTCYSLVDYITGDAERLPFIDNCFDAATCISMLHHLPDPSECLREVFRVTKPGGRVFANEPNGKSMIRILYRPLKLLLLLVKVCLNALLLRKSKDKQDEQPPLEVSFTLPELKKLFVDAGFIVTARTGRFFLTGRVLVGKVLFDWLRIAKFAVKLEEILSAIPLLNKSGLNIHIYAEKPVEEPLVQEGNSG